MGAGSPPSAANPGGARTPGPGIGLVAGAKLPLAFIGLGLVALALAVVALAMRPQFLLLPHFHPHVVALAHLWLPGFLLSVTMGAIYQLMPVVLGAALRLPLTAAWWHFGLHAGGVLFLVFGFALGRFECVAFGGAAVSIGVGFLLVGTWRTFLASARRDAVAWSFPAAVSWLAATVFFGVVLAMNRRVPFLPLSVVDLLRAHAHLGLAGFFLTLLQGATFQLVPMFTMADLCRPGCIRAGLWLSQSGLLVLAPGLACGRLPVTGAGAALLAAGIGSTGVALVATFRSRRRRMLEPGLRAFAVGAATLAAATGGGLIIVALPAGARFAASAAVAYGLTIVVGALSFMILGMLCKIVPFLVWMKTYGPRAGHQKVPLATALGSRTLENGWLVIHGAALVVLVAAVLTSSLESIAVGAVMLAAAILAFLANVVRILRHLGRPATAVEPRPRAAAFFS